VRRLAAQFYGVFISGRVFFIAYSVGRCSAKSEGKENDPPGGRGGTLGTDRARDLRLGARDSGLPMFLLCAGAGN
jgi:hypothetical protein